LAGFEDVKDLAQGSPHPIFSAQVSDVAVGFVEVTLDENDMYVVGLEVTLVGASRRKKSFSAPPRSNIPFMISVNATGNNEGTRSVNGTGLCLQGTVSTGNRPIDILVSKGLSISELLKK